MPMRRVVIAALRKALDEVASREKQLTLVVPDAAVRVLILDFDSLPSKAQEALPIVRFRLRKLTPFEVDDAAVSYQVMRQQQEQTARAGNGDAGRRSVAEYESAVRAPGYEPGVFCLRCWLHWPRLVRARLRLWSIAMGFLLLPQSPMAMSCCCTARWSFRPAARCDVRNWRK